jgi:hypothetical protein
MIILPPIPKMEDLTDRSQIEELKQYIATLHEALVSSVTNLGETEESDEPVEGDFIVDGTTSPKTVKIYLDGQYKTFTIT